MRLSILAVLVLAAGATAVADTYVVHPDGSGDFPTIQAAIDAVVDGDIIELTDGLLGERQAIPPAPASAFG